MKINQSIFLLFLFVNSYLQAQEELKVININNSNFPLIEVLLKADKKVDVDKIFIFEKNEKVKLNIDTLEEERVSKEQTVLFITDIDADQNIRKELVEIIKTLNENDYINLGYILNTDTSKNIIHFVSPEFSNNHFFFINILELNLFKNIDYELSKRSTKKTEQLNEHMLSGKKGNKNFGVIFLSEKLGVKPEPVSKLLTDPFGPTYVLLTRQPEQKTKKELIERCTRSGGIFTVSNEQEIHKTVLRYLEDISLQVNQKTTNILRISFKTKQRNERNYFRISYLQENIESAFNKTGEQGLNNLDRALIFVSSLLFVILIISGINARRKKIKREKEVEISPKSKEQFKPIEINVKTKGYNKTYFFEKHIIKIGRSSTNDIIIPDRTVSGSHAVINKEGDSFMIQDLGSTNGVIIDQKKIKKQKLNSSEKIKLGAAILLVRI